ncbi:hypothetical protein VTL71DRAFT_15783 [Oculimacula yallundae]|uniref:Uncharacterized protein n=1 Tax=Oculimacula yallundae TaxID=86028 RepID=A0ABR4CCM9_9HELO
MLAISGHPDAHIPSQPIIQSSTEEEIMPPSHPSSYSHEVCLLIEENRLVLSSLCDGCQYMFFVVKGEGKQTYPCGDQPCPRGSSGQSCLRRHPWRQKHAFRDWRCRPWRLACWPPWKLEHLRPGRTRRRSWRRSVGEGGGANRLEHRGDSALLEEMKLTLMVSILSLVCLFGLFGGCEGLCLWMKRRNG